MTEAAASPRPLATAPTPVPQTAPTTAPQQNVPALRQDLELIATAPDLGGARRWLIYDPLQHKFVAISQSAHALLQVWDETRTLQHLVHDAWEQHAETIDLADAARFVHYLQSSGLTLDVPGGWRALAGSARSARSSFAKHLLHTYLFFRVPLVQPERFLRASLPVVRPLGTRSFALAIVVMAVVGLYCGFW